MFLPVRAKSYVACSIKMGIRLELLHFPEKRSTHSVGQVALNHQTMIKDFFCNAEHNFCDWQKRVAWLLSARIPDNVLDH